MVAAACEALGAASGPSGWSSDRARTWRPGPGRAATRAAARRLHRAHRRRPGRDGAAEPAPRERGRRAWPACGRDGPAAAARPASSRHRGACAPPPGSTRSVDPSNDDPVLRRNRVRHEVLPLLDDVAGRDLVPVLARQADLLAEVADHLTARGRRLDPTDARALAAAPPVLARVAVRALAGRRRGRRRPSARRRRRRARARRRRRAAASPPRWPAAGASPAPPTASASNRRDRRRRSPTRPRTGTPARRDRGRSGGRIGCRR